MHVYIAGPMRGIPYFNKQAFLEAEEYLTEDPRLDSVYNSVRSEIQQFGSDLFDKNPTGDFKQPGWSAFGFDLNKALADSCDYICNTATHMFMLKGWETSSGARAEHALAVALGLEVWYEAG